MFIKLQHEQIALFWNSIRYGMIESYKIPRDFQQDFAIESLRNLLSGLTQSWVGYQIDGSGNRKLCLVMTTRIINEKNYGVKTLFTDSFYAPRPTTDGMLLEAYNGLEAFARVNNCITMSAELSTKKLEDLLIPYGFKKSRSTYIKIL